MNAEDERHYVTCMIHDCERCQALYTKNNAQLVFRTFNDDGAHFGMEVKPREKPPLLVRWLDAIIFLTVGALIGMVVTSLLFL